MASLYRKETRGQPPVAPAILALALILEAYTGVSDDEVIEATVMDRRGSLVLDCLDCEQTPISRGTFVAFRKLLIEAQMDRRFIERTGLRLRTKARHLARARYGLLWIAARCGEPDASKIRTIRLRHALKKVMRVVADQQRRELVEVAEEAGAELVCSTSLKATFDRDWDQQREREEALDLVLQVLQVVETWVQTLPQEGKNLATHSLKVAKPDQGTRCGGERGRQSSPHQRGCQRAEDQRGGRRDAARSQEPQCPC